MSARNLVELSQKMLDSASSVMWQINIIYFYKYTCCLVLFIFYWHKFSNTIIFVFVKHSL